MYDLETSLTMDVTMCIQILENNFLNLKIEFFVLKGVLTHVFLQIKLVQRQTKLRSQVR